MKIYISGPVTGHKNYKEQFGSMSYLLKKYGHKPVNPVQVMDSVRGVLDYKTILNADLDLLEGCDAILLLPGWQDSHGACKEYDKAVRLGIKIYRTESTAQLPEELKREAGK